MSESKTSRRPVSRQTSPKASAKTQPEVEALNEQPSMVEEEVTIPVEQVPADGEPHPTEPTTDEAWEDAIRNAKEETAEQPDPMIVTPADVFKETKTTVTTETITDESMEAEIRYRVEQELLKRQQAEQEAKVAAEQAKNIAQPKTADELKKQEEIAIKNDVSAYVHFALGDSTDFETAFQAEMDADERPDSAKRSDPTPYEAGMALNNQLGQKNIQHELLRSWITDILEKNTNALQAVSNELRLARIRPKIGDGSGPKKLSGATAKAAVISSLKGMYRVQLYNSGFWLDLRPTELLDVDGWMQEVDTDFTELGRVMGGHAHSILDVFLKQKFFDILPSLVQRSNFVDYADADKLINNISYHDYDTLLWAFCCMYYREGVGAGIYCTNPECRHIDEHQFIDLRNICFVNVEAFNAQAQAWMMKGARAGGPLLTEADLKQYRDQVLGFKKTLSLLDNTTVLTLEVPTIRRFVEESMALVSKLQEILNGVHDIKNDLVSNQLTYHLYRMLLPWISALDINDAAGNLVYHIEDRAAIYEALAIDTYEQTNLYAQVTDFIRDSKCSMYAAITLKCPKCGKVADLQNDNMVPLDMQYLFFCLSCRQLEQTGASF